MSSLRTAACCLLLLAACQRGSTAPSEGALPTPAAPKGSPACVHYKDLEAFLPRALNGYTARSDHASIGKYGDVSVSEAERVFVDREGAELSVRILDTTLRTSLRPAITAAAHDAQQLSDEDPVGPLHLPMSVGFVRYEPDELTAEVNLLVGDRYVVAVTSKGREGTHAVRRAVERLDLVGLSRLRAP